jgi:PAS domain-containing protein
LLPEFDGMRALEITLTYDNTIHFIILTGAANEEIIIDAMKSGANDYILKEHINRLPFAIQEAIKKRNILQEGKQTIASLEFLSQIVEQSPYSIISTDMEGRITSWNKGAENIFGYSAR